MVTVQKDSWSKGGILFVLLIVLSIGAIINTTFFNSDSVSYSEFAYLREQRANAHDKESLKRDIKIGVAYNFALKEDTNNNFLEGIELAVKTINQHGGILNRKVTIVQKDTKGNKAEAMQVAKEFAIDTDIIAVISPSNKDIAKAVSVVYEYAKIVYISTTVTDPAFTREDFDYIFRNIPDDVLMGKALGNLADKLNFQNVVILHSVSPYAQTLADLFAEAGMDFGLNIPYRVSFTDETKTFKKIVDDISPIKQKDIDYDAILITGSMNNLPLLFDELRANGIYAPIITGDLLNTPELLKVGSSVNNVIVPTYFNLEILNKKTQDFISFYKKEYTTIPSTSAVQAYDAIMLLKASIKKAKTIAPSKIVDNLKYIGKYESVSGTYSLNTKGDVIKREIYFNRIVNQKFKFFSVK